MRFFNTRWSLLYNFLLITSYDKQNFVAKKSQENTETAMLSNKWIWKFKNFFDSLFGLSREGKNKKDYRDEIAKTS
jgi:hypothetical protein